MPQNGHLSKSMRDCAENCLNCHAICVETMAHCLMRGGEHAAPQHQRLLADCAQACATSADFLLRMSDYHHQYCEMCANLCQACAEDCERLDSSDEMMAKCAKLCRRCEQSCRQMGHAMV